MVRLPRVPLFSWTLAACCAVASVGVSAEDQSFDLNLSAGLNYETADVEILKTGEWPAGSVYKFAWRDANGESDLVTDPITATFESFANRTSGRYLPVDGYIATEDGETVYAAVHKLLLMGQEHDEGWMDEDAASFEGSRTGSGVWSGEDMGTVSNGMILVDTVTGRLGTDPLLCTFATVPSPRRGYTIATKIEYVEPSNEMQDPTGRPIGFTIAAPGADETADDAKFYILDDCAWRAISKDVCDPTNSLAWEIQIAVDTTQEKAAYYVRPDTNSAWTILGTGGAPGAAGATRVGVWGTGAISGYQGDRFDTQLVQLDVTFGDSSLFPGVNFEQTIVTGRVTSALVHDSDRTNGVCTVTLYNSDGTVAFEPTDFDFTVGGDLEFYVKATDLTPGRVYTAVVTFDTDGEANSCVAHQRAVMGRPVTNETWGTDWLWVHETARTFGFVDPGTGEWDGRELAATNEEWIVINTVDDEGAGSTGQIVSFTPTNELGETTCYVTTLHAVFNEAIVNPDDEEAVFGITVSRDESDGTLHFCCLSNRVWRAVPSSVMTPTLGKDYQFTVYAEEGICRLTYTVLDAEGEETTLFAVDLDPLLCREYSRVDFCGTGALTNLVTCGYSTELVRLNVDFDSDTLYPGTNFEATTANGVITFTQLWDTDHTRGVIKVTIRDKWGDVIGIRKITFHDLSQKDFKYYVTGLVPGESYTVQVSADITGLEVVSKDSRENVMARIVSNEAWHVEGEWIRENVETFLTNVVGTGEWNYAPGAAVADEEEGCIVIDATDGEEEIDPVAFNATNSLPEHTGYEIRTQIAFDRACEFPPIQTGRFGVTLCYVDESANDCQFLVLSNSTWVAVDPDVYEPKIGTEYAFRVKVDEKTGFVDYYVRGGKDLLETVIATFELDDLDEGEPTVAKYYGQGRVRKLEGDGFDVSLVKISVDFDEQVRTPGTNFAAIVAAGTMNIRPIWPTDKTNGTYMVIVRDARGTEVHRTTVEYWQLVSQDFRVPIEGLDAGGVYDVEVVATLDGDEVGSDMTVTKMARIIGNWIDEDAETFGGERTGTGLWDGTNGIASVYDTGEGRVISVAALSSDETVRFTPTNDELSVRCSTLREVRMRLSFNIPGWYADGNPPAIPAGVRAGATVWRDDDADETALAVIVATNGVSSWRVLEDTVTPALLTGPCDVYFLVDTLTGYVRYDLLTSLGTNRVCQFDFTPDGVCPTNVSFKGEGWVWSVDGDTWDPNLITSATNEFMTLNDAILGSGSDEVLSPLWRANQWVTVGRGSFQILDTNNWLVINFPTWFYVVKEKSGDITIYRFNESNNWIDYAEGGDSNVETNGTLFLVKTPEGLSWIAARATNEWISGRIELANDIDLSLHNWTPIAGFSGTFDGRGHSISNLNNKYHNAEFARGEYIYGPTNAWGRTAYGLFGTATNATLTGVTFEDVAISNLADSVAALAGALAGNCAVSNVTVESGTVRGLGGAVAGVAGYADFTDFLVAINNTNRAAVAAETLAYGDRRYAAGILCVAGPTDESAPLGTVTVTNNVNAGVVSGLIYDADLTGGNVAQILAGTTWGARFGTVRLTDNVASGSVDATIVRSFDNVLEKTNFPAVNLASIIWGSDEDGTFYMSFDSNEKTAVPVDPVRRTARLLTGIFRNGSENETGLLNDQISALPSDESASVVTMPGSVSSWGPVVLDRNLTFDLGGYTLNTIWINNPFVISNGVSATVRNGTIIVGPPDEGEEVVEVFAGDTSHLTQENLVIEEVGEDFYERTTLSLDGEPISAMQLSDYAEFLNTSGAYIELYTDNPSVTIDADEGVVKVDGHVVAKLSDCYSFKITMNEGGAQVFEVKVADSAAPKESDFVFGASEVSVTITDAKPGFYYAIQHKATLLEEWPEPAAGDWVQATGTSVTPPAAPKEGESGYYRVIMTDKDPALSGE